MDGMRALLDGVVDYAGLFPPAGLGMGDAVRNYAEYRRGPARWMLGRFIVPVRRLDELAGAAERHLPRRPSDDAWPLSALAGDDVTADVRAIGEFNCSHAAADAPAAVVDTVELRAAAVGQIETAARAMPEWLTGYVEVPLEPDPAPLIDAIGSAGLHAKARTGGVTPDAIPGSALLARFLAACVRRRVPFKATAGLHHPVRAEHPLTYDASAPRAVMHGYLNVFVAAALLESGGSEADAQRVLDETDPAAFRFDGPYVSWRAQRFDVSRIAASRQLARSFGSCSFTEPVEDLAALTPR
jgi:hypothetical protein